MQKDRALQDVDLVVQAADLAKVSAGVSSRKFSAPVERPIFSNAIQRRRSHRTRSPTSNGAAISAAEACTTTSSLS